MTGAAVRESVLAHWMCIRYSQLFSGGECVNKWRCILVILALLCASLYLLAGHASGNHSCSQDDERVDEWSCILVIHACCAQRMACLLGLCLAPTTVS